MANIYRILYDQLRTTIAITKFRSGNKVKGQPVQVNRRRVKSIPNVKVILGISQNFIQVA